jgi:O-Antigen ligase
MEEYMQANLKNNIPYVINFVIAVRIIGEAIYIQEKPGLFSFASTALFILAIFFKYYCVGVSKKQLVESVALLCVMFFNTLWIDVNIFEAIKFGLQIAIPTIFVLTYIDGFGYDIIRTRLIFIKYVLPVFALFAINSIIGDNTALDLIGAFDNNPMHPLGQVIAKSGLLLLELGLYYIIPNILLLLLLNVRSAFLSLIFSALVFQGIKIKEYVKYIFVFLLIGIVISLLNVSFGDLIERFVTKGRIGEDGDIDEYSSGRLQIWEYYINRILIDYDILTHIFGEGPYWLVGGIYLSAHNDLLNVYVCYGLVGILYFTYLWVGIISNVEKKYVSSMAIMFLLLIMTNGVLFHQSNVIFALLAKKNDLKNI